MQAAEYRLKWIEKTYVCTCLQNPVVLILGFEGSKATYTDPGRLSGSSCMPRPKSLCDSRHSRTARAMKRALVLPAFIFCSELCFFSVAFDVDSLFFFGPAEF